MSANRPCASDRSGHCMHWILAKKSHEYDQPVIEVKVTAVHHDGRVDIEGTDLNWRSGITFPAVFAGQWALMRYGSRDSMCCMWFRAASSTSPGREQ